TRETDARASSVVRGLLSGISALSDSGHREFADAVVVGIADIDRAVGGNGCAVRPVERGGARRTAIAVAASPAAAGDRGDRSGPQVHPADRVVFGIDDQEIALAVDRQLL